jgi:hypothetical protein
MSDEAKRPSPKYLEGNHDRHKRSLKHEKRLSVELGGKTLPNSGATRWSSKWAAADPTTSCGDLATAQLHIEHKRTEKDSIGVKREWLAKVREGARRAGKDPALILTYETKNVPPDDWILIPLSVAKRFLNLG